MLRHLRNGLLLFAALIVTLPSAPVSAHELGMERLTLRLENGEVRGQATLDPHRPRSRAERAKNDAAETARVVSGLETNVRLELDGKVCKPNVAVRELWVPGGASPGDILTLRCAIPSAAPELRVFAGEPIEALVVTIESRRTERDVETHSVSIRGGSATPPYRFQSASPDWRPGGAHQFESGEPAAKGDSDRTAPAPSGTPTRPVTDGTSGFREEGAGAQALRYVAIGFHHILPAGWDHVLFVASLVLGSGLGWRRLVWQLSAFTLAHTLTLALGTLGWIAIPSRVIEPLIALSIAFVAIENLRKKTESLTRIWVVFGFGLLHGLGFAGALSSLGLAKGTLILSLFAFNIGVELGQLVVVACLLAILIPLRDRAKFWRCALPVASSLIAAIGLGWAVERLLT